MNFLSEDAHLHTALHGSGCLNCSGESVRACVCVCVCACVFPVCFFWELLVCITQGQFQRPPINVTVHTHTHTTHTHTHTHVHTHTHTHKHTHMHARTHARMHTRTHASKQANKQASKQAYVYARAMSPFQSSKRLLVSINFTSSTESS